MASNDGPGLENNLQLRCVVDCQRCCAWHPDGFLMITQPWRDFDVYRITTSPSDSDEFLEDASGQRRIELQEVPGGAFPERGWVRFNETDFLKEIGILTAV